MGALTEHYGSLGRLADYRRQFERTTRHEGADPSTFAIALETFAVKAFRDMGANARLRLIRDRFITGHENGALHRHLDSVPPETPIRDIVDRCRVWESHADIGIQRIVKPGPERTLPVYRMVAAVTAPPARPSDLEALECRLLPTSPVPTLPPQPKPMDLRNLLKRLLSRVTAPTPTPPPQTGMAGMEALLQRLLPGMPGMASRARPGPARRDWNTIECFSCGKSGPGVSRCPEQNETFPFMLPGWTAEKVGSSYVMISPRVAAERAENGD